MKHIYKAIEEMSSKKEALVLVEIAEGSGSMPRQQGAIMLVRMDGSIVGSVGGGLLEANAIKCAQQAIVEKKSTEMTFDMSSEDIANSQLICGGKGVLSIRYYDAFNWDELKEVMEKINRSTLYIFGGGHISLQLYHIAELLEMSVVIVEDRKEFANAERFPDAECIVVPDFWETPCIELKKYDMVVIVTRGHLGDRAALTWALRTRAGYIGMIGSRRKRDLLYKKMQQDGIDSTSLEKVHSPIGLSIGAQYPAEVAVSIAAELIAFRYGKL